MVRVNLHIQRVVGVGDDLSYVWVPRVGCRCAVDLDLEDDAPQIGRRGEVERLGQELSPAVVDNISPPSSISVAPSERVYLIFGAVSSPLSHLPSCADWL